MIKTQILEAIKQMPNSDRLEVIEFALRACLRSFALAPLDPQFWGEPD